MNKFIPLIVILLFTLSCSKKKDPDPVTPIHCELTSESATGETITISYNSAGLADSVVINLTSLGGPVTATILYDAGGHLTDIFSPKQHQVFQTGTNGKPSSETYYTRKKSGADSTQSRTTTFTWGADTLVQKTTFDASEYLRYEYDANGNLAREYAANDAPEAIYLKYFNYDTKISPVQNFPFDIQVYLGPPTFIYLDYDPVRKKHNYAVVAQFSTPSDSTITNYSCTYNAEGYALTTGTGSYAYKCK